MVLLWDPAPGGGGRIRTYESFHSNGFQDRRHRPLGHASTRCGDKTAALVRGASDGSHPPSAHSATPPDVK